MEMKIKSRAIFIGIVMVVCLLGIIGFPKNFQELKDNVRSRIRMGLDLKGGTHLVLQVQVEDAVNITADQVLERLRDERRGEAGPSSRQAEEVMTVLAGGAPCQGRKDGTQAGC